jgi:hypothetical protein
MSLKLRWPMLGAILLAGGYSMSQYGADAAPQAPEKPKNVCEFNRDKTSLQIRDTTTNDIKAQLDSVAELKDRVVTGPGAIIASKDHIIETGIQFRADFVKRSCEAKHRHDSWGSNGVAAPMAPNVQSLTFTVK